MVTIRINREMLCLQDFFYIISGYPKSEKKQKKKQTITVESTLSPEHQRIIYLRLQLCQVLHGLAKVGYGMMRCGI